MGLTKYIQNKVTNLKSIQYLPRWIIFSIDLFIVISSAIFSFLILKGIGIDVTPSGHPFLAFGAFFLIHFLLFFITSLLQVLYDIQQSSMPQNCFLLKRLPFLSCIFSIYVLNI